MRAALLRRVLAAAAALGILASPALANSDLSFSPSPGSTVKITANATPTSVSGNLASAGNATKLRVCNASTVLVFVRLSTTPSPTATAGDLPLLAASCIILDGTSGATAAAALSSTTTAVDTYWTWGEGGV